MVGLTDPFALFLGNPVGSSGTISSNCSFDTSLNNSDFVDSITYNPDEISLEDLDEEDSSDVPVAFPSAKPDLVPTSQSECVEEQSQNLSPVTDCIGIVAHDEQKLVSTNAKQRLLLPSVMPSVEQKSVSTDVEQKSVLTRCEQNWVSTDVEQKSVVTDCEQNLVSTDVEQKELSTDVEQTPIPSGSEQKVVSTDVEQKSILVDSEQNLVSADKTVDSESEVKPKEDSVCRTLKRRNLSIYGTEGGMGNDS